MNVILLGYRGCGKSSVGRWLADELRLEFVDLDVETCAAFGGRSVADIWAQEGEPAFRAAEVAALKRVLATDGQVIALGGGTPVQAGADAILAAAPQAVRIYLRGAAETLAARIAGDPASAALRPSIGQSNSAAEEVAGVLAQREPVYERVSDLQIDVDDVSIEQVADAICHTLTDGAWATP